MAQSRQVKKCQVKWKWKWGNTETVKWTSTIKEELDASAVTQTDITDKKTFRRNVFYRTFVQMEKRTKTGAVWSDERKRAHKEKTNLIKTVVRFVSRGPIGPIRE